MNVKQITPTYNKYLQNQLIIKGSILLQIWKTKSYNKFGLSPLQ